MIVVDHVSKRFILKEFKGDPFVRFVRRHVLRQNVFGEHWALRDVSLEIPQGDSLALLGVNGCGKSTLLRLISGVTEPTSGEIRVTGTVGGVVDLGEGFILSLNGVENIKLQAAILGVSHQQIKSRLDDIIEFSELGRFIYTPVRHYSWGMFLRLGFSIAVHTDPDVLLVDEALAVGDGYFQWKCLRKIDELKREGKTLLFVSHIANLAEAVCRRAAWIHEGRIAAVGPSSEVSREYNTFMHQKLLETDPLATRPEISALVPQVRLGSGLVLIRSIRLLDRDGNERHAFENRSAMQIELEIEATQAVDDLAVVVVLEKPEQPITILISSEQGQTFRVPKGMTRLRVRFDELRLHAGNYELTVALASATDVYATTYDAHVKMNSFTVTEPSDGFGFSMRFLDQPAKIQWSSVEQD